jgi:hypothetical protein
MDFATNYSFEEVAPAYVQLNNLSETSAPHGKPREHSDRDHQ